MSAISTAAGINGEGPLSAEQSYAVPASGTATNQITLNWAAVPGATGYKIYRGTATGTELYLASVGAVIAYADTSATAPAGKPPGGFTLNSLTISSTYTGRIGTGGQGGYWQQPTTAWTIGTPAASGGGNTATGSGRIKLDFGSVQFTGTVLATGSAIDTGFEPVMVKGTHASNVLEVLGGNVGVAAATPGETATVLTTNVSGSGAILHYGPGVTWGGGSAVANIAPGATFIADAGTGATGTLNIATGAAATVGGATKVATVNDNGTAYLNNRPAAGDAVGTLTVYPGATADFSGNPAAASIGALNLYAGNQPTRVVASAANPAHLSWTTLNRYNGGNLSLST